MIFIFSDQKMLVEKNVENGLVDFFSIKNMFRTNDFFDHFFPINSVFKHFFRLFFKLNFSVKKWYFCQGLFKYKNCACSNLSTGTDTGENHGFVPQRTVGHHTLVYGTTVRWRPLGPGLGVTTIQRKLWKEFKVRASRPTSARNTPKHVSQKLTHNHKMEK